VAIAENRFTQAEDHAFDAIKPSGEPGDTIGASIVGEGVKPRAAQ